MNILTWYAPQKSGAFQKSHSVGTYSSKITKKPETTFNYTSFEYIEAQHIFKIDGVFMTEEQKAEIKNLIEKTEPPKSWIIKAKTQEAKNILTRTDWYYIRKQETGEEVPEKIKMQRISSRNHIRGVENGTIVSTKIEEI